MNPSRLLRTAIVISLICIATLQIYARFTDEVDPEALSLLVYHGALALFPDLARQLHYPVLALWVVTYCGLFFFQRWARGMYLALVITGFVETMLGGMDVYMPLDSALIVLSVMCDGAIFALAFTQPLAARFSAKPAVANQAA